MHTQGVQLLLSGTVHEIDDTRSHSSSSRPVSTELVFDVDLYAYGRKFVLKPKADNNVCMLTRLLHKKADGKMQYSIRRPMPGLFEHRSSLNPEAQFVHQFKFLCSDFVQ